MQWKNSKITKDHAKLSAFCFVSDIEQNCARKAMGLIVICPQFIWLKTLMRSLESKRVNFFINTEGLIFTKLSLYQIRKTFPK